MKIFIIIIVGQELEEKDKKGKGMKMLSYNK